MSRAAFLPTGAPRSGALAVSAETHARGARVMSEPKQATHKGQPG
jgi:hypothetical protein